MWDEPVEFADIAIDGLGVLPDEAVRAAMDRPVNGSRWQLEDIALGPVDTPRVSRMVVLASVFPDDANERALGTRYEPWHRDFYLFVLPETNLDDVIAVTRLPHFCYAHGIGTYAKLPDVPGPLALVDPDGDDRDEMLLTGYCMYGHGYEGAYTPGEGEATYNLAMEVVVVEQRTFDIMIMSHAAKIEGDPQWMIDLAKVLQHEGLYDIGSWAEGMSEYNPDSLYHSQVSIDRTEARDTIVVRRFGFEESLDSPIVGLPDFDAPVDYAAGDVMWEKRFAMTVDSEPVVEVTQGASRAVLHSTDPSVIRAVRERQEIRILGRGFTEATSVRFIEEGVASYSIPEDRIRRIDEKTIVVTVGVFPQTSLWHLVVENQGFESSSLQLTVVAP